MQEIMKNDENSFNIITDEGKFQISHNKENEDLYWTYLCEGNIDDEKSIKVFRITKENPYLYQMFSNLYESVSTNRPYLNSCYPISKEEREKIVRIYDNGYRLYDGHEIRWYSDNFAYFDNASNFAIRKVDNTFIILFTKSHTEPFNGNYLKTYSVKMSASNSKYTPYNIPFMAMYEELETNYHSKKRVLSK